MADGEANVDAANDIVELEAMRKGGFSWHPCQVSLCTRGQGLIVLYGNNLEEMLTDEQEIFGRIRVRSTPLQADDCASIREGDNVLATESSHVEGVFYDALVEKYSTLTLLGERDRWRKGQMVLSSAILIRDNQFRVVSVAIHVRHSKRIHCRCSFTIKWLHCALPVKALTVPASAIMKLATKTIHHHPTISAFFSMQKSSNDLDATLCSAIGDGNNWEMDINVLLEQQIKEISTSHGPREDIWKDYASGHEVDLNQQSRGSEIEASLNDPIGAISFLDKLNGFNGSENKHPVELISETCQAPSPSMQEELRGTRLLLNPLAARAALASLRSEFPQTPGFSRQSNEKGDMTDQHTIANLPEGSKFRSFSAVDCSSNAKEKFSLTISTSLQGNSPNLRSIVKKLFPTSSPSDIVEIPDLSSGTLINGTEKKNEIGEKQTTPSAEMRLTQSQIQRDNRLHGTSQVTNNNDTQSRLTDTLRVTRSRIRGAGKTEANDYNAAGRDHAPKEYTELETFHHVSSVAPQNCLPEINSQRVTRSRVKGVEKAEVGEYNDAVNDNAKPGTSTQETSTHSVAHEEDVSEKDGMVVDVDSQKSYSIQDAGKRNNAKRLTRSAVPSSEDTETTTVQLKQKLRKSSPIEFTSLSGSKSNEQIAEEGECKKVCTRVTTTRKSSERSGGSSDGGRKQKCAGSKSQERRFSSRLRFLPRTRSQNKA